MSYRTPVRPSEKSGSASSSNDGGRRNGSDGNSSTNSDCCGSRSSTGTPTRELTPLMASSIQEEPTTSTNPIVSDDSGMTTHSILDISILSVTRYSFVDHDEPRRGPIIEAIEPPTGPALVGSARPGAPLPDSELVRDFTEERDNRYLARIGKRLLLPESYADACRDLHSFMATHSSFFESVQRNLFKCLKICARLSKLPGYSLQLLWQVVDAAYRQHLDKFEGARAATIETWHDKLSNRIRLAAITPAADGSAPPRLPSAPPRELLDVQARNRMLPLPDIAAHALNAPPHMRTSSTLVSTTRRLAPAESSLSDALALTHSPTRSLSVQSFDEPTSRVLSEAERHAQQATELEIIENQLRILEQYPPHQLGPMMRAALNLLVEMRFRLQLGLPRTYSQSDASPELYAINAPTIGRTDDEDNTLRQVIDLISYSRQRERRQQVSVAPFTFSLPGVNRFASSDESGSDDDNDHDEDNDNNRPVFVPHVPQALALAQTRGQTAYYRQRLDAPREGVGRQADEERRSIADYSHRFSVQSDNESEEANGDGIRRTAAGHRRRREDEGTGHVEHSVADEERSTRRRYRDS